MISIIVPAYNIERYISRALDSILAQTYSNIEIIVVDDGSQDGTGTVIDDYAARYPNQVKALHISNSGVTKARLTGVSCSKGDWIGFVDGDDVIEQDMYERLLSNAEKYDAQISHCGYQMCFSDGRIHYFHNTGVLVEQDKIISLKELLSGSRIEPGLCYKLYHKSLLQNLLCSKNLPTDIKINEDLLMNYYLFAAAEKTVFEDWCPYHYIIRNSSATHGKLNEYRIYNPIQVKEIIRKEAIDEIYLDAQLAYINTCINIYNSLLTAGSGWEEDIRRVRSMLLQEKINFRFLGSKRRLMVKLIGGVPIVYRLIYLVYHRFFEKKIYS